MRTKIISMVVTEEEYNVLRKLAYKDAIKNNKRGSVSAFVRDIILDYTKNNCE